MPATELGSLNLWARANLNNCPLTVLIPLLPVLPVRNCSTGRLEGFSTLRCWLIAKLDSSTRHLAPMSDLLITSSVTVHGKNSFCSYSLFRLERHSLFHSWKNKVTLSAFGISVFLLFGYALQTNYSQHSPTSPIMLKHISYRCLFMAWFQRTEHSRVSLGDLNKDSLKKELWYYGSWQWHLSCVGFWKSALHALPSPPDLLKWSFTNSLRPIKLLSLLLY